MHGVCVRVMFGSSHMFFVTYSTCGHRRWQVRVKEDGAVIWAEARFAEVSSKAWQSRLLPPTSSTVARLCCIQASKNLRLSECRPSMTGVPGQPTPWFETARFASAEHDYGQLWEFTRPNCASRIPRSLS